MRKFSFGCIMVVLVLCLTSVYARSGNNQNSSSLLEKSALTAAPVVSIEPTLYAPLQESLVDHFEDGTLTPWTTSSDPGSVNPVLWGMRDTNDVYGPNTAALYGYQYAGNPDADLALYPSPGSNPGNMSYLTSPTLNLSTWDSLYITFNYWADLEGEPTNFDGCIVQISSDNGSTWKQIDSLAQGHLNPTYDDQLANTGLLFTAWAYCYDTDPNWISVASKELFGLGYVTPGTQIRFRFVFAYDALDGGPGFFIDDVVISSEPPPDLQAPTIVHTPLTDTPDTLNEYTVQATITDEGAGVDPDSVYLYYQIESGPEVAVQMINTGGDVYEGDIPIQTYHTDVYYRIEAADLAVPTNLAVSLTYNFEVTTALTISYDDGQPYSSISGLEIGDGLFNHFSFSDVGIDSGKLHKAMFYFSSAGNFDLRAYRWASFQPGPLLDSIAGLSSPGYGWHVVELDAYNMLVADGAVVGYIITSFVPDTVYCLTDPLQTYPQVPWGYIGGAWGQNPVPTAGDIMIRIKVIPLSPEGIEDNNIGSANHIFAFAPISPNPARSNNIVIQYQISEPQNVILSIYDVSGKLVKTLVNSVKNTGTHTAIWNGSDEQGKVVSSGVYLLRLQGETNNITQKLIITH